MSLRDIHTRDLSDLSSPNPSLPFPLSLLVQFLPAWLLVCSELQSGARSFIQNQMRVWQPLHLRHLSARQLRLGKSSCLFTMPSCFFNCPPFVCNVWWSVRVNAVQCGRLVLVVFERFAVALPASTSLSPCRCRWSDNYSPAVFVEQRVDAQELHLGLKTKTPRIAYWQCPFCTSSLIWCLFACNQLHN